MQPFLQGKGDSFMGRRLCHPRMRLALSAIRWRYLFGSVVVVLLSGVGLASGSSLAAPGTLERAGALATLLTPTPVHTSTPIPLCGPGSNYSITSSLGDVVPGTTLVPNSQCEDCVLVLNLPFGYSLYDTSYNNVFLSVNGNLQFNTNYPTSTNACLPAAGFPRIIVAHWDDLSTVGAGLGIYTSTSGTAPNRIFNIEWRATYAGTGGIINFGVRLYEGQRKFDVIFNHVDQGGSGATVGVQEGPIGLYTQYECNTTGSLYSGLLLTFVQPICDTPTPTYTSTRTFTPTPPAPTFHGHPAQPPRPRLCARPALASEPSLLRTLLLFRVV